MCGLVPNSSCVCEEAGTVFREGQLWGRHPCLRGPVLWDLRTTPVHDPVPNMIPCGGSQGLSHPDMPHSQFIKQKIFHKSKVTNRLCDVITLVLALSVIDSCTYIRLITIMCSWGTIGTEWDQEAGREVNNKWTQLLLIESDSHPMLHHTAGKESRRVWAINYRYV